MKNALYLKFVIAYLILGFIGFFTISTLGSTLIEHKLVDFSSSALYKEANAVANTHAAKYYNSQSSLNDIYDNLTTLSSYENSEIWLINPQGEILLNTSEDLNTQSPEKIINFDPASFNSGYYQIGHFFTAFRMIL